ncbi:acireductone synthase [Streptomyces fumanus]|uniref:acireductone synthase n=1 Tax=Streptomyces fumanus TaxID=67302 RepID=UPI0033E21771
MTTAVILDVEGTTSATTHVHDVLFPYARDRIASWVAEHGHEPAVRAVIEDVHRITGHRSAGQDSAVRTLIEWADQDRKAEPLKRLQGMIWAEGYARGDISGHIYWDTLLAVGTWFERGLRVFIYSSGSVRAQREWFSHSQFGDLSRWIHGYFDLRTAGPKDSEDSYRRICEAIGVRAPDGVFVSDTVTELDAAADAGLRTAWIVRPEERRRPGTEEATPPPRHPVHRHLLALTEAGTLDGP